MNAGLGMRPSRSPKNEVKQGRSASIDYPIGRISSARGENWSSIFEAVGARKMLQHVSGIMDGRKR